MKLLIELRHIITKHKIKNLSLLIRPTEEQSQSLIQRFYNALNCEKIKSNSDMNQHLYDFEFQDSRFQKIKESLRDRMINILLFINFMQDRIRSRDHAKTICHRYLTASRILKKTNRHRTNSFLAKRTLSKALYYELTYAAIESSQCLHEYYSTHDNNLNLSKKYRHILNKQLKNYRNEIQIHKIQQEATIFYEASRSNLKKVNTHMKNQLHILLKLTNQVNTSEGIINSALALMYAYADAKHLDKLLALCIETLKKLDEKPFSMHRARLVFLTNITLCHIRKKSFIKATKSLQEAIQLNKQRDFNWLKTMEIFNLLYLRSAQYDKALEVIQEVYAEEETLKRQKAHTREIWYINRAFVEFLLRAGLIKDNGRPRPGFRLSTFMNDVPHFTKDKQGLNLNILILQFLHQLIDERKHDRLIGKTESLRQYAYQYLDELPRPQAFIKMLCIIPEANFDPQLIQKRAQKWLDELRQHPLELADQPFEIELIPFETLWEIVLDILRT